MSSEPSPARRGLFFVATVLLPLLFFLLVEGGLRLAGFGDDYPLFVEVPGHPDYLVPNPQVGRRYFQRSSVVPEPFHDAFRKEKTPETLRIVVQGASTAAGFPYGHGGSFSRMLQQRLQGSLPEKQVEVVNTAMAAVNSFTLLDLSNEIIRIAPDAVLIYAGHNEYYGALGVASRESIAGGRSLVRLYLAIDQIRIVQALRRGWTALRGGRASGRSEGATLMEEMARERVIPYQSDTYRAGLRQFEANLTDLLCRYQQEGVPAYVGTLVSNERDHPPFDSGLDAGTNEQVWREEFARHESLLAQGDTAAALRKITDVIGLDDGSAAAYFARAELRRALGDTSAARADYQAAKDRDRLPFRASEAANDVIRRAASTCGAGVVDIQQAFAGASEDGIPGSELILEHLHPNVDGYFLMADTYYGALAEGAVRLERIIPRDVARTSVLVTTLDSVLASLHVRRLRNNWPFQPSGVTRPDTFRVSTPVERLALDVLQGRRTWLSATGELGAYLESTGDMRGAMAAALALIQEEPYRGDPYALAGNLMLRQGAYAGAVRYFEAADRRSPSSETRRLIGHTMIRAGSMATAIPWLLRSLELDAGNEAALYDLGVAYVETGRTEEARSTAQRLLGINPGHSGARRLLAHLE